MAKQSNCYDDYSRDEPAAPGGHASPRASSEPPLSKYIAVKKFIPRGALFGEALPPKPSGSGYRYYVPGPHIVSAPIVLAGSKLAGDVTDGWAKPPSPTGYSDLESAVNAALQLFALRDITDSREVIVRTR